MRLKQLSSIFLAVSLFGAKQGEPSARGGKKTEIERLRERAMRRHFRRAAVALASEALHRAGVGPRALHWSSPGAAAAARAPGRLAVLAAALHVLGAHLLRVISPQGKPFL